MNSLRAFRKVIQIATVGETRTMDSRLFALCDDGTIWASLNRDIIRWRKVETRDMETEVEEVQS